jgi:hypothetical protein
MYACPLLELLLVCRAAWFRRQQQQWAYTQLVVY